MLRRTACLLTVCLVSHVGLARAQSSQPPPGQSKPKGTSAFRGRVLDADSNQPLRKATVIAFSDTVRLTWATLTDADGRYELKDLPAGQYAVSATKVNYTWVARESDRTPGIGAPVTVVDGQAIDGLDLKLQRAGVITGRILDEFNEPVAGVQVAVVRLQSVQGQRRLVFGRSTTTNDIGEFRLFGLPPGEWYLEASLNSVEWRDRSERSVYVETYYPGTGNLAEARKLTIGPGQVLSTLAMTLRPVRAARISGIAYDSQGLPLPQANVIAISALTFAGAQTQAGVDGSFVLGAVPPGEYTLRAGRSLALAESETAMVHLAVTGDDIAGVALIAAPPSRLRGRVLLNSTTGTTPRPSTVRITAYMVDGGQGRTWMVDGGQAFATVKDDSTFEITLPQGHAVIRLTETPEWRVKRVRLNGIDVTEHGFDVPARGVQSNLDVELTNTVTQLSGIVATAGRDRTRNSVIVFAQDPTLWGFPSRYVAQAPADRDSLYRMRLTPGRYYAIALADVDQNEWNTQEFLETLGDRAVALSIDEGESKILNLNLVVP
jgi:hypothetical protein